MTTIDCDTCPVRGRHCGDCVVPVLGRIWMAEEVRAGRSGVDQQVQPDPGQPLPLDRAEMTAVGAFVRAGLLSPRAAESVRAEAVGAPRRLWSAVG
jgi:hypothetical protein